MLYHLGLQEDARRVEVTTAAGHLTRDVGGTAGVTAAAHMTAADRCGVGAGHPGVRARNLA